MVDEPLKAPADDEDGDLGGRPPYEPNDYARERVRTLAQAGVPQTSIAAELGISKNTLKRYYARVLIEANTKVQALLGQTLLKHALGSPAEYYPATHPDEALRGKQMRAEVPVDKTLLIFACKARLGYSDRVMIDDNRNENGGDEFGVVGLTESERIRRITAILESAKARGSGRVVAGPGRVGTVSGKPAGSGTRKRG